ncbi:MAG: Flp pilus assembly protein CpaB [Candidatus Dormibacteria bacterium]
MIRGIYLAVVVALSLGAGALYLGATREVSVVVAAHDLPPGAQVAESDLAMRHVNPDGIPAGTLRSVDDAVGRWLNLPVLGGQALVARELDAGRAAHVIPSWVKIPNGYRVVSIPITPSAAVGGALHPGDRVEVVAVPNALKSAGSLPTADQPQVVGESVLVLGMRNDAGGQYDPPAATSSAAHAVLSPTTSRLASVLLAVPPEEVPRYAEYSLSATFWVALTLA